MISIRPKSSIIGKLPSSFRGKKLTQGNVATAMLIETGEHTTTSAIALDGKVTYCFDFSSADDGYGFDKDGTAKSGTCVGWMLVKDQDGNLGYINVRSG